MADLHDIIVFSSEGEKILGVVIEHYINPLDDFYVVYADYALHKSHNPDEDATIIMDNVIIPSIMCIILYLMTTITNMHMKLLRP